MNKELAEFELNQYHVSMNPAAGYKYPIVRLNRTKEQYSKDKVVYVFSEKELLRVLKSKAYDRIEYLEWKQKYKIMPLEEEVDVSNELTSLRKL